MPDLSSRPDHEARITAAMQALLDNQRTRIAGNPAAADWQDFRRRATESLTPLLAAVYLEAAVGLLNTQGLGFDRAQFEQQAQQWATGYSARLAEELTANLQQATSEAVARAHMLAREDVEQEFAAHLAALLLIVFSDSRASTVGITETTRMISAGERGAVAMLRRTTAGQLVVIGSALPHGERVIDGEVMVPFWFTERDGLVCKICRPLHGQRQEVWQAISPGGPPIHPRCRCWLEWRAATQVRAA